MQSPHIGEGTRIWQYCVILPEARIGADCNICAHVLVENDVIIGDRVTVKSGVQIWDGVRLGDDVFVGPNATFTNDNFPRSRHRPERFLETVVEPGASIGANATVLPGVTIGAGAMIGAGAVVTKNAPPNAIVVGNPGTIVGYTDTEDKRGEAQSPGDSPATGRTELGVGGCTLYALPLIRDLRGNLSVVEYDRHLPFVAKRCFWVFDVPSREVRGEHAHRTLHQYLLCVKGTVHVVVDDGKSRREVVLDQPNLGLHIPPGVWGIQYKYSSDAVLLVLASDAYSADDYIRNYDEFRQFVQRNER